MTGLAVAICTYNNADSLRRVLECLAAQTERAELPILVVDNNCTDHTGAVVAEASPALPGLRRVVEHEQGLTPARVRAVRELADAVWIAFVDDDCLLDPGWIASARGLAEAHPEVGALGGRVTLLVEGRRPPWLDDFGWAFAGQDYGDAPRRVDGLAGAGMIVRRDALVTCGWLDGALLADRIADRLVSGGDVEMALRLARCGGLFYSPDLRLDHLIPERRLELVHVVRLVRGLGVSALQGHALVSERSPLRWLGHAAVVGGPRLARSTAARVLSRFRPGSSVARRLDHAFAQGWYVGLAEVVRRRRAAELVGAALRRG